MSIPSIYVVEIKDNHNFQPKDYIAFRLKPDAQSYIEQQKAYWHATNKLPNGDPITFPKTMEVREYAPV